MATQKTWKVNLVECISSFLHGTLIHAVDTTVPDLMKEEYIGKLGGPESTIYELEKAPRMRYELQSKVWENWE